MIDMTATATFRVQYTENKFGTLCRQDVAVDADTEAEAADKAIAESAFPVSNVTVTRLNLI